MQCSCRTINICLNNHQKLLNLIIVLLKSYISSNADEIFDRTENGLSLLHFILEQLEMFYTSKTGRWYSTLLTSSLFFWHLTSSNLYGKLREIFILPSCSRFRQLSCGITVHCGEISLQYMQQRVSELTLWF